MRKVTKAQAESAARMIGKKFGASDGYGPKVFDRRDYGDGCDGWIVSWEEGPFEWTYRLHGGFDEELFHHLYPEFEPDRAKARQRAMTTEVPMPKGVVAEPMTHYSVALYREEEY